MATHSTFRENALRVVAVLGLIAILLLGAWGIIQLAFRLPGFLQNFGKAKESVVLTLPAQTTSDKATTLSWKHTGYSGEYAYAVSYTCAEGLSLAVPVPTGAYQLVPCDTPFNYIGATSTMPVIPVLAAGTAKATSTISVAATKLSSGTVSVRGSAKTMVSASTTPAVTTTPGSTSTTRPSTTGSTGTRPSSTYVPSGRTQNLYGLPDLSVEITQAPQAAAVGSRISLQFVVSNIGTNVAQGWSLNAVLPYDPIFVYPAGAQRTLYPGDKIIYTLGFDVVPAGNYGYDYYSFSDNYYGGQAQATIEVDPMNTVSEASEYNNSANAVYQVY